MTLSFLSRRLPLLTGLSAIALMPALPAAAQSPAAQSATASAAPAPLSSLVAKVDIPYEEFTLKNGLRVIVHTDRKAPIVAVSVWYHVGSRFEPAGKTGFAHLFEHLMFYGSENADGPFFGRLEDIGATDWNGTTWFDRTNYFETVPTGALDRALFLESDRMGHLLGAVTQVKLDTQRGVVQNEKRMGETEPYGLVEYAQLAALMPEGHPYRHSTIGSMADLNAASLADVQSWFKTHYGPNNAVLVLAGDIDAATAKAKVEKWFGNIPAGPAPQDVDASVPTLDKDVEKLMHDHVAATRLYRNWVVPGVNSADLPQLDLAMAVFGGLGSSRLDNALVRDEKVAVSVKASIQPFEKLSLAEITVDVKPGADPVAVGKRLDQLLADYLAKGPSADEVQRAATRQLSGTIGGLEKVGGFSGKAVTLAEGAVYSDDPGKYKKDLAIYAAATPQSVAQAARKWLGRPVLRLTVAPGERSAADNALAGNAKGEGATHQPAFFRDPDAPAGAAPEERHPGHLRAARRGADGAGVGGVRRRQRGRRQGEAGHGGADRGAAGRRHDDPVVGADRRGAGTAGRGDQRGQQHGPHQRRAVRAQAQSRCVARPAGGRDPQPGLPPRGGGAAARPGADADRGGKDAAHGDRAADAAADALWHGPSLWHSLHRIGHGKRGQGRDARGPDRLP